MDRRKQVIISIRVDELDGMLFKTYAEYNHESVSAFLRRLALEHIERDYNELCARIEKYNRSNSHRSNY